MTTTTPAAARFPALRERLHTAVIGDRLVAEIEDVTAFGKPSLGCATTQELIEELHARAEVARTIGEPAPSRCRAGRPMTGAPTAVDERAALQARLEQLNDDLSDIDERRAAIKGQIEKAQADRHTTYLAVREVVDDVTWARIVERHEEMRGAHPADRDLMGVGE